MSITPLREAIRRLSGEGLIELDNHKGRPGLIDRRHEARQLFEVRLALEPAAVALAAERRTDDDIAAMRAARPIWSRSPVKGARTACAPTAHSTARCTSPPTTT